MIIKVCGMRDSVNIRLVDQLGADWMGFIFYPKSPRYVSQVPAYLPHHMRRVGVFVNADLDFICRHVADYRLDLIQLHGQESVEQCALVKRETGLPVIKAFGIKADTDFSRIMSYCGTVDYLLFDTHTPAAGGSGRSFDHSLLSQYKGDTPFLLSGGLGPDSVVELQTFSHPAWCGIDLNSRFEMSPALKSVGQLQTFLAGLGR